MLEGFENKLHQYLSNNNPDILLALDEENKTGVYLIEKINSINSLVAWLEMSNTPDYIIEEACMDALTKELRPSKYNYIKNILADEFEYAYHIMQQSGTLVYEITNMIRESESVFEQFEFSEENEDSRQLKFAVVGTINKYLGR